MPFEIIDAKIGSKQDIAIDSTIAAGSGVTTFLNSEFLPLSKPLSNIKDIDGVVIKPVSDNTDKGSGTITSYIEPEITESSFPYEEQKDTFIPIIKVDKDRGGKMGEPHASEKFIKIGIGINILLTVINILILIFG